MSIEDERDLREKLGAALDDLGPRPLPLQLVVRRGRAVVIRRRLAAVAAATAVIAAAVAVPTLLRAAPRTPPTAERYHVTVRPPGPDSPQGLIASGLVNRARWQLTVSYNSRPSNLCYSATPRLLDCATSPLPTGRITDPASLQGSDYLARLPGGRYIHVQMLYGTVRRDVDYLRVALSNGQVLTAHPVAVFGSRHASFIAVAVPFAAAVRNVAAFSGHGELAHAIPFTGDGSIWIVRWLPAGAPALPRPSTARLAAGTTGGTSWSVRAYLGPWGICFISAAVGSLCTPGPRAVPSQPFIQMSMNHARHLTLGVLQLAPRVSYLTLTRVRGGHLRIRPVVLGGRKYCVVPFDDHNHAVAWAAYDASGRRLGGGPASGW